MGAIMSSSAQAAPGARLRHVGQASLHPDAQVLPEPEPVPGVVAERWALVPLTWAGDAWWYGWAPVQRSNGDVEWGWWLVPRDPGEAPWLDLWRLHD